MSLFSDPTLELYLVDASAWFDVDKRNDAEDVWRLIERLIRDGRLFAPSQVIEEIFRDGGLKQRLGPYEGKLTENDRDDIEYFRKLGEITRQFPAMCHATGTRERADGYVVALAELDGYTVVADETANKRPNRKIPGVCKQLQIRCLTLEEFVQIERARQAKKEDESEPDATQPAPV